MTPATATAEDAAKVERPNGSDAIARVPAHENQPLIEPNPAKLPPIPQAPGTGLDPMDFVRAHRIHIKDGSLFKDAKDPQLNGYLVVHPAELDPKNEAQLRQKLLLTFSITNPSFYESPERTAIALNLGQLIPLSLAAKRSQLLEQVRQFNAQVDNGKDGPLHQQAADKHQPFQAIVRDTMDRPNVDPAGLELLKNGLALYMLIREKLTRNGYYNRLSDYVTRMSNPDQVLGDLADNVGVTPQQFREAVLTQGIEGAGRVLGLDAQYINEVKQLADHVATQDFGYNLVEHWHLGRQRLGPQASLQEKIQAGIQYRIQTKIDQYRNDIHHNYSVAGPIAEEEKRIAYALNLVDPIQRKLLYKLGYEICFSPEATADDIAFHRGIYGLHRKAANDLRDVRGTYRIYFAGKGDLEGSMRTLVHEVAHNFWPDAFTPEQTRTIDRLTESDKQRFEKLHRLLGNPEQLEQLVKLHGAYQAGNPQERAAILAAANELFAPTGVQVDQLLPHLRDPYELRNMVNYAQETLQVEGARYNRSGYDSPQERFREVVSRFAELRQVRLRGQPELLKFIAPGLTEIFDHYYIPHLHKVYERVEKTGSYSAEAAGVTPYWPNPKAEAPITPAPVANAPVTNPPPETPTNPPIAIAKPTAGQPPHPQPDQQRSDHSNPAPSTIVQKNGLEITPAVVSAQQALEQLGVRYLI